VRSIVVIFIREHLAGKTDLKLTLLAASRIAQANLLCAARLIVNYYGFVVTLTPERSRCVSEFNVFND
jgi:hypothetical protein